MDDIIKILTDEELETSFPDDALKTYIRDISRYPNLSIEKQKELGQRYRENGNLEARKLLINCNLRLVVSVANHYKSTAKHLQLLDLIQEGNLGLIRAVESYNPEKGAFTTYAIPWIKQKITRELANKDAEIRKPVYIREATAKYLRFVKNYEQKSLVLPPDADICNNLDISVETLKNIRDSLTQNSVNINQTIDDDKKSELEEFIFVENHDYDNVLNQIVNDNLLLVLKEILSPIYYFVIYHRILSEEQKTLEKVAFYLNITRERVRQIEISSLKKIKPYMIENSSLFAETLNKIKQREGYKFNLLKKTPLSPTQIIKYMYLKDDLSDLERKLYELNLLGKYKYRNKDYTDVLGITLEELKQVVVSLEAKINKKFSDLRSFKNFQEQIIKNYSTDIFKIDINKKEKIIDYRALEEKYSSLNLEDILNYFKEVNYNLTKDEERLLKRYFGACDVGLASGREIEKEVNVLKYGFRSKDKCIPLKKLYKEYLRIKNKFNLEQQLYLETYIFAKKDRNIFKQTYPESSLYGKHQYLIDILERSYYHIYEFFENDFTKENWLKVKEKYFDLFTEKRIEVLDLYYGVEGKSYTISELAEKFNMDYIKMNDFCSGARDLAIKLFSGIKNKIDIDKSLYVPYITDLHYDFTPETRYILKLFIIESKEYDEISKITGLNKTRISNIITDGIRKIDNYRFGIIPCFTISSKELNDFFEYYKDKIIPIEKEIIKLKHLNHMENKDIAPLVGKPLLEVNKFIRHFNILYESYIIRNVNLIIDDITKEIARHKSESIWSEEYKKFASFYFGLKSEYNPTGMKLKTEELMKKMDYTKNTYYHIYTNMIKLLKSRKIDFVKPENNYIPREKLDKLLEDVHLPISDKEREIICHLFELKGASYMTLDELSEKYAEKKQSVRRRYQRAIVSIYKYLNKEIEGTIHYETDIVPILKYFSISDRQKMEDLFKNNLTYEEMAKKYGVTFNQIVVTMNRIRNNIKHLMTNKNAKKFDFDYYLKAINNPDLPFLGDLNLATQIFDLVFGMNGERTSVPLIIEKLNLDFRTTAISRTLYNLMVSVCKLKDGITKDKTFTFEQVYTYYLNHYNSIPDYRKKIYQKYFKTVKNNNSISGFKGKLSYYIITDLIIDMYPDAFVLGRTTKEEVVDILNKYKNELNRRVKSELMRRYGISERRFMNGKDLNHIFKILYTLDTRRKELEVKSLVLKKGEEICKKKY